MPKLQIDGVEIADLNAHQAATLERQLAKATYARVDRVVLEIKEPLLDDASATAISDDVSYENGTATLVIRWETSK